MAFRIFSPFLFLANVRTSCDVTADCRLHARPGALNFTIALIKVTKILELEESHAVDEESSGLRDLARNLQKATQHGVKKAVGAGIPNTNWIRKDGGQGHQEAGGCAGGYGMFWRNTC